MSVKAKVVQLLTSATTVGDVSEDKYFFGSKKSFQVSGFTSAGAGAATVIVEATNDLNMPYVQIGTIALVLSTTPSADGFVSDACWKYFRVRVSAISGTDAEVSANATSIGNS